MAYTSYCDTLHKNQCVDKNGNCEATENLNNLYTDATQSISVGKENDDGGGNNGKSKKQADQKAISRFQAMAMSDDDDYGKSFDELDDLIQGSSLCNQRHTQTEDSRFAPRN